MDTTLVPEHDDSLPRGCYVKSGWGGQANLLQWPEVLLAASTSVFGPESFADPVVDYNWIYIFLESVSRCSVPVGFHRSTEEDLQEFTHK